MGVRICNKSWLSALNPLRILHEVSPFLNALDGAPRRHFLYGFPFAFSLDFAVSPDTVLERADIGFLNRLILQNSKPIRVALAANDPVDFIAEGLIEFEALFCFHKFQKTIGLHCLIPPCLGFDRPLG